MSIGRVCVGKCVWMPALMMVMDDCAFGFVIFRVLVLIYTIALFSFWKTFHASGCIMFEILWLFISHVFSTLELLFVVTLIPFCIHLSRQYFIWTWRWLHLIIVSIALTNVMHYVMYIQIVINIMNVLFIFSIFKHLVIREPLILMFANLINNLKVNTILSISLPWDHSQKMGLYILIGGETIEPSSVLIKMYDLTLFIMSLPAD